MEKRNLPKFSFLLFVSLLISINGFHGQAKMMDRETPANGKWDEGRKSITIETPITILIDGTLLIIQSTSGRSDITINISNDLGFSYKETVPSANTHFITIDLSNAPKGEYRLDLTNQWEDHLYGDFEIR